MWWLESHPGMSSYPLCFSPLSANELYSAHLWPDLKRKHKNRCGFWAEPCGAAIFPKEVKQPPHPFFMWQSPVVDIQNCSSLCRFPLGSGRGFLPGPSWEQNLWMLMPWYKTEQCFYVSMGCNHLQVTCNAFTMQTICEHNSYFIVLSRR